MGNIGNKLKFNQFKLNLLNAESQIQNIYCHLEPDIDGLYDYIDF